MLYNECMETVIAPPATADELYETSVKIMLASERLKLATRILNDIPPASILDYSDEWSEEDLRELTEDSVRRFYEENPVDDGLV
jgi:hypothetical protein